jgi:flagellar hook-basal body complex protein FliE
MIEALKISPSPSFGGASAIGPKSHVSNPVVDFASHLADTVRAGEGAAIAGVRGDMPLQKVVETVMEAERTLTTAVSIRDKIVSAYLEMTRMQI